MLEEIGTLGHEMISTPDPTVERRIHERLARTADPVYY